MAEPRKRLEFEAVFKVNMGLVIRGAPTGLETFLEDIQDKYPDLDFIYARASADYLRVVEEPRPLDADHLR